MEFILNGRPVRVEGCEPQTTLLDFLRSRALTGSKEGCAEGECGACTVLLVQPDGNRSMYVPVNSCLMFLPMAAGQEIYTVEALAENGRLTPAQSAMAGYGGSQCGYCTPGFVVSMFAEHHNPHRKGPIDPHALGGNLCRCTGYRPIRDAALSLGDPPDSALKTRMASPAPELQRIQYGASWHRPISISECLALMQQHPDTRLVAGATDLAVESNLKFQRWPRLISLDAITELRNFRETDTSVQIGAALTLTEIERLWINAPPVMQQWFPLFASPLIRNRATLGGNLATASPIGDSAPLLLALDADVRLHSRTIPLRSFFLGYRKTALASGDIIVSVDIPKPFPAICHFFKVSKRRMDDISTVAAAVALHTDSAGRIERARFAFGGVAATPILLSEAEEAVLGKRWDPETISRVQSIIARTLTPLSDHRGSAAYRLAVAQSVLEKVHSFAPGAGPC
jgi:xanthine dehydrogenase small subunit